MAKHPRFTEAECKAFAEAANPHSWLLTSDSLHEQAVALYGTRKVGGVLIRRDRASAVNRDNTNKATFLLCALALENAIKAFLVYEHPAWVSEGYLHSEICSHKLVTLTEQSDLITYRSRDRWVLAAFEAGNESWIRYPCGRRADDIHAERPMPEKLWIGYMRVMSDYGTKLIRLLGKGWVGPHGAAGGHWELRGQWLSDGTPLPRNFQLPAVRK